MFWWSKPRGLAFEMTLCVLRARLAGWARPEVDLEACTVRCDPDEQPWSMNRTAILGAGNRVGTRRRRRRRKQNGNSEAAGGAEEKEEASRA